MKQIDNDLFRANCRGVLVFIHDLESDAVLSETDSDASEWEIL